MIKQITAFAIISQLCYSCASSDYYMDKGPAMDSPYTDANEITSPASMDQNKKLPLENTEEMQEGNSHNSN